GHVSTEINSKVTRIGQNRKLHSMLPGRRCMRNRSDRSFPYDVFRRIALQPTSLAVTLPAAH
uniref:hypothetical protein n=1 Tax=Paracoccus sp. TRP TaxID=412597 RepID=UPI001ED8EAD0